jgi:predicted TIM-barrel fold metal-dependent hydrolase
MIDLDSHLMEPQDFLVPFAPVALRDALVLRAAPSDQQIRSGDAGQWSAPGAFDRGERRVLLDQLGIERQVVLPGLAHVAHLGSSLVVEAARAQRRAMTAWADADPRFVPVAVVPTDEPDSAIDLIGDAAEAGFRLVLLTTARPQPTLPTSPDQVRVWHALADSGLAGVLHFGTTGTGLPTSWRTVGLNNDPFADAMDVVLAHQGVEAVVAAMALSGMFSRTPSPRLLVVEHGSQWVPGLFRALDSVPQSTDALLSIQVENALTVVPFAVEPVGQLIDAIGDRVLGFATGHPHPREEADAVATFAAALGGRDGAAFFSSNGTRLLDGGY